METVLDTEDSIDDGKRCRQWKWLRWWKWRRSLKSCRQWKRHRRYIIKKWNWWRWWKQCGWWKCRTVEPRLTDTTEMRTSTIMQALYVVLNVFHIWLCTIKTPEMQTPPFSITINLSMRTVHLQWKTNSTRNTHARLCLVPVRRLCAS